MTEAEDRMMGGWGQKPRNACGLQRLDRTRNGNSFLELQREHRPTITLILECSSRNISTLCCFKPLNLLYFVSAARGN
jgi:hypothetical protein